MKLKYGLTIKGVSLYGDVNGWVTLKKAVTLVAKRSRDAAARGLNLCGLDLKGKAMLRAPIGENTAEYFKRTGHHAGELRASAFLEEATPEVLNIAVGFGPMGTKQYLYALRQHEELTWRHPNGGESQYLIKPLRENIKNYIRLIAETIKKAVT